LCALHESIQDPRSTSIIKDLRLTQRVLRRPLTPPSVIHVDA